MKFKIETEIVNISDISEYIGSVAQSRRLRVTDLFEGQSKITVVREATLKLFIFRNFRIHTFHSNIYKMFSISSSVKSENLDDTSTLGRQYLVTYWTSENKAIRQQFDSGQQINELLTSQWKSFATNMDFVVNSQIIDNDEYFLWCSSCMTIRFVIHHHFCLLYKTNTINTQHFDC